MTYFQMNKQDNMIIYFCLFSVILELYIAFFFPFLQLPRIPLIHTQTFTRAINTPSRLLNTSGKTSVSLLLRHLLLGLLSLLVPNRISVSLDRILCSHPGFSLFHHWEFPLSFSQDGFPQISGSYVIIFFLGLLLCLVEYLCLQFI